MMMARFNVSSSLFPPPDDIDSRLKRLGGPVISGMLNWLELLPYLLEQKLVDLEDQGIFLDDECPLADGCRRKFTLLEECLRKGGKRAYAKFVQCVRSAKQHMGHAYITAILEGREFASEEDIRVSQNLKCRIRADMPYMMDINLDELVPLLFSSELLTQRESEKLGSESSKNGIKLLFDILDTKGPTAHLLFVQCLGQEHFHPAHSELYDKLTSKVPVSRKRRTTLEDVDEKDSIIGGKNAQIVSQPSKRTPNRLAMEGPLKGEEYHSVMCELKSYLQKSEWKELECRASLYIGSGILEFQIVSFLELGLSWIYRADDNKLDSASKEDKVTEHVEKARALCSREEICGDNACFLRARCDYILANLYRSMRQYEKARKYSDSAKSALYIAAPGIDSSTACYTDACIQVESPDRKCNMKNVEALYNQAANDAEHFDSGNIAIAFHARMHLAELCLSSSPAREPGRATDKSSIGRAKDCLAWVEERITELSDRSKGHFHLLKCDYYRDVGDRFKAIEEAKIALEIATKSGFPTQLVSAKAKLKHFDGED